MEEGVCSSDNISYDDEDDSQSDDNEQTSLLQPHGISTGETKAKSPSRKHRSHPNRTPPGEREYIRQDKKNRNRYKWDDKSRSRGGRKGRHRKQKKTSNVDSYHKYDQYYPDNDDFTDSSSSYDEYGPFDNRRAKKMLHKKHQKLMKQWKAEFFEQAEILRKQEEERSCFNRLKKWTRTKILNCSSMCGSFISDFENFISNLPLTIGAVALAVVTLGTVWFKFAEEMMDTCRPVHFHSNQCTFMEFPGCFYCDTTTRMYRVALNFHLSCSAFAGIISLLFVAKIFIARDVFIDEMNSPTTASPAGLICMTLVCVFAGRGFIGEVMVTIAASLHFCIAVWFIHMAGAYNILPDPSWYPNTVGIGISAVKMWLYHPMPGHLLMAVSIMLVLGPFLFNELSN
jgi:hypothetical protein